MPHRRNCGEEKHNKSKRDALMKCCLVVAGWSSEGTLFEEGASRMVQVESK